MIGLVRDRVYLRGLPNAAQSSIHLRVVSALLGSKGQSFPTSRGLSEAAQTSGARSTVMFGARASHWRLDASIFVKDDVSVEIGDLD
jgi:hypothetical protein